MGPDMLWFLLEITPEWTKCGVLGSGKCTCSFAVMFSHSAISCGIISACFRRFSTSWKEQGEKKNKSQSKIESRTTIKASQQQIPDYLMQNCLQATKNSTKTREKVKMNNTAVFFFSFKHLLVLYSFSFLLHCIQTTCLFAVFIISTQLITPGLRNDLSSCAQLVPGHRWVNSTVGA